METIIPVKAIPACVLTMAIQLAADRIDDVEDPKEAIVPGLVKKLAIDIMKRFYGLQR